MNAGGLLALAMLMAAAGAWVAWRTSLPSARMVGGAALVMAALALAAGRQFALAVPTGILGVGLLRGARAAARSVPQPGQTSKVQTTALAMHLDHDSGAMDGEVLSGSFTGRILSQMTDDALKDLMRELKDDPDSLTLLLAYLDRHRAPFEKPDPGPAPDSTGRMSVEEAYRILGLEPGAGLEDVRLAHRRLMKRVHPDLGGSDALAAMINAAKARLEH
jgi:DnaJ-domain-containing protein 1